MSLPDRYSVRIHDRSHVEYRDADRTVILPAGMLDRCWTTRSPRRASDSCG
jgi:hypothetical protein